MPSDLRKAAEQIIARKSASWRRFLSPADDLKDTIEHAGRGNVQQGRQYRLRDPHAHILTRLGHVSVNPHDPLNTNMLTRSYVHFGKGQRETARCEVIAHSDGDTTMM